MSIRTFVAGLFSCPRCVTLVGDVLRLRDQRDRARRTVGSLCALIRDLCAEVVQLRAQNECQRANVAFSRRMAEELRATLNEIVTHTSPDEMRVLAYGAIGREPEPPPCPPSSITGASCLLPKGHAADSATRFHRYPVPVKP